MARKPTRFSTEREAVDHLKRLKRTRDLLRQTRAELRRLEAEDKDLSDAYNAWLDAAKVSEVDDLERNIHLERREVSNHRALDLPNVPDELLPWLAMTGGIVGRVGVIDKLPDSTNKDSVKRYIATGGVHNVLTFGAVEEEETDE